jgi:NDP-sugar pyrophosphorylase family protein
LSLIKDELDSAFLIVNGDTLTTLSYSDLVDYHNRNRAAATVALKQRQMQTDFGVVEIDSSTCDVRAYTEKPTIESLVSMGVSALNPDVLEYVKPNEYLDFPKLIQSLLAGGKTVKGYVFDGYWLDIGRPDDYERANLEIEEIYGKLGIG